MEYNLFYRIINGHIPETTEGLTDDDIVGILMIHKSFISRTTDTTTTSYVIERFLDLYPESYKIIPANYFTEEVQRKLYTIIGSAIIELIKKPYNVKLVPEIILDCFMKRPNYKYLLMLEPDMITDEMFDMAIEMNGMALSMFPHCKHLAITPKRIATAATKKYIHWPSSNILNLTEIKNAVGDGAEYSYQEHSKYLTIQSITCGFYYNNNLHGFPVHELSYDMVHNMASCNRDIPKFNFKDTKISFNSFLQLVRFNDKIIDNWYNPTVKELQDIINVCPKHALKLSKNHTELILSSDKNFFVNLYSNNKSVLHGSLLENEHCVTEKLLSTMSKITVNYFFTVKRLQKMSSKFVKDVVMKAADILDKPSLLQCIENMKLTITEKSDLFYKKHSLIKYFNKLVSEKVRDEVYKNHIKYYNYIDLSHYDISRNDLLFLASEGYLIKCPDQTFEMITLATSIDIFQVKFIYKYTPEILRYVTANKDLFKLISPAVRDTFPLGAIKSCYCWDIFGNKVNGYTTPFECLNNPDKATDEDITSLFYKVRTLKYLPRQLDKLLTEALRSNWDELKYIYNQTEEVCLDAGDRCKDTVKYIRSKEMRERVIYLLEHKHVRLLHSIDKSTDPADDICPICLEPTTTSYKKCNHRICEGCLITQLKLHDKQLDCHLCRAVIVGQEL